MKKITIKLSKEQRVSLQHLITTGTGAARKIMHAHILLKADSSEQGPDWSDTEIQAALGVGKATIWRVRQRFVDHGLDDALNRRPQPERPDKRILDGEKEAHLIALTCGEKPDGEGRWSLRLLAQRLVKVGEVDAVSHETVRHVPKKNKLKPWLKEQWCIAPKANAEFVACMEDVLAVYVRAYDPQYPQVCMDEVSKQLLSDTRPPRPVAPGSAEQQDFEYERHGVCNIFLACEPLAGKRYTQVTVRRTKVDWALFMRELVDVHYPQAKKIVLVMDNLNTHTPAAFYEAFPPAEARRLVEKLEIHHTPKHGSWLNMAEIELSVLSQHPLSQRIGEQAALHQQVEAWQQRRNQQAITVDWRFTTADARIKLKHLYPSLEG
ncbi:MAG TPA: IS630 family transposase [Ktedonobacteraceae bacterium]|nr:IS630 family transposase [Ktedonobacteraceae bacterium]